MIATVTGPCPVHIRGLAASIGVWLRATESDSSAAWWGLFLTFSTNSSKEGARS